MTEPTSQPSLQEYIARMALWCRMLRLLSLSQWVFFCALTVVSIWVLMDRLLYLGGHYTLILQSLGVLSLLVLLAALFLNRVRAVTVAALVDESADLKNLVASGLQASESADEVSASVAARATAVLAQQKPREVFPLRLAWPGRYALVPCLVLVGALFIPPQDLFGRKLRQDVAEAEHMQIQESTLKLLAKLESVQKHMGQQESVQGQAIAQDFDMLTKSLSGLDKKLALQKLGEFESQYGDEMDQKRDFSEMTKGLSDVADPAGLSEQSQAQLDELTKNLKAGDFASAADALKDLAEKLKDEELSAEERKAIAREMGKMAKQMMPQGLNPELAKALAELASSSADIGDLAKQCESASDALKELSELCSSCAGMQAMKEGLDDAKRAGSVRQTY